jgi:Zn-dependent protease with chaperone function
MSAAEEAARGRFSDGFTAGVMPVEVTLLSDALEIAAADGRRWRWPAELVQRLPEEGTDLGLRLTSVAQPDARLVLADAALLPDLRRVCRNLEGGRIGAPARLRAAAGVFAVLALLVGAYFGLPLLAVALAPAIPQAWQQNFGARTESEIASALSLSRGGGRLCNAGAGTAALGQLLARLAGAAALEPAPHVTVLEAGLVNAFALPGNRIVLTKGLIDFAGTADELAGVLAHELGHLRRGDPLAALIARFEWNALASLVFGSGSISNFGQTIVLLSYSRTIEAGADEAGIVILAKAGIDSAGFAAIMRRMGERQAAAFSYLQSHPATADRVAAIERLGAAGGPALPDAAWRDLKRICTSFSAFSVS